MARATQRVVRNGHAQTERKNGRRLSKNTPRIEFLEDRQLLATLTWTGNDALALALPNWTRANNWSPAQAPVNGDDLIFPAGAASLNNLNDFGGLSANSVTFTGGGYNLAGNALTLGPGGLSISTPGTFNQVSLAGLNLATSTALTMATPTSNMTLNSPINGASGLTLTKGGLGSVSYTPGSAGTFAGTTVINDGLLALGSAVPNSGVQGPVQIGNGDGNAAFLLLLTSNQIADASAITVLSDGNLNLNTFSDTIGALTVTGGTVDKGSGDLSVTSITMTGGTITSSNPFAGSLILNGNVTTNNSFTTATITNVFMNLTGGARTFTISDGPAATDFDLGATLFNGTATVGGTGRFRISGNSSNVGAFTINAGLSLIVDGSAGNIILNGGLLGGNGTVGTVTALAPGGTVSPGTSPGILNSGSVTFNAATTFTVELNGPVVGAQYDQLNVTGTVTLGNATLNILPGFAPATGTRFTIINNDGTDPVNGAFANFPLQNTPVIIGGTQYIITYNGGDGNDVVLSINSAPTAINDVYALPEGLLFNVPAVSGILANDLDPNGDKLQSVLVVGPTHGTLTLNGDGSFSYAPSPGYTGQDSFTYYATDGFSAPAPPPAGFLPTNIATVTLFVNAVNESPVTLDDAYTADRVVTLTVPAAQGVLANDFSPDAKPITATLIYNTQHGSVVLAADGSFTYTPNPGYAGPDSFAYTATDGLLTSNPTIVRLTVIPVPRAPVAVDDAFSVAEDKVLTVAAPGVLGNDSDPDTGTTLRASVIAAPSNGTLVLASNGSFVYTPNANFNGTDTFTYQAFDGELSSTTATVTITVTPVADAPTAGDDAYTTQEDAALTVAAPGILINDTNPDGGTPTITVINGPQHGTLAVAADGSIVYTPTANYHGSDSFTYFLTNAGLNSNVATVSLTVQSVADAPVGVADAYTVTENKVLNVPARGVLANDTNVDGDTLTSVLITAPSNGSLVLNSDGSFTYTPNANFNGTDTFTYRPVNTSLQGNVTTVTITVSAFPTPPTAGNDAYTTQEDTALTVAAPGLLLNDQNPDGGLPTITVINGPQRGTLAVAADGSFVYTPAANFHGVDSFTYFLTNAAGQNSNIATVSLTVQPVVDPPVGVNDAYQVSENHTLTVAGPGVLANDTNVDGDPISAVVLNAPTNGTLVLNSNGSFTYTPDANFFGTDTFTYQPVNTSLTGQQVGNVTTVTITVTFLNVAPVGRPDAYSIERDQTLIVPAPGVLGNDFDPDNGPTPPTLTAVLVNTTQHGTLALNANGSFTYDPDPQFQGPTDSFTYKVSDGDLLSSIVTVTINLKNIPLTTVALDPKSDTGVSRSDRITKDSTPTFFGVAGANLDVILYAQAEGGPVEQVGITRADAAGNYVVTVSSPLSDGEYRFFVEAFRTTPNNLSTGRIDAGPLLIDTVAPRINEVVVTPRTGQIYVTYQDTASGLDQGSVTSTRNYSFARLFSQKPRSYVITSAQIAGEFLDPTDPLQAVLSTSAGRRLIHGQYIFAVVSGGVRDVAGNALDGEFNGGLPSGNGAPGGNFNALFVTNAQNLAFPQATGLFVPILNTPTVPGPGKPVKTQNPPHGPITQPRPTVVPLSAAARAKAKAAALKAAAAKAAVPAGPKGLTSKPKSR